MCPADIPRPECKGEPNHLSAGESEHAGIKDLLMFLQQEAVRAGRELGTTGRGEIPKQEEGCWQVCGKGGNLSISALEVLKRGQAFRHGHQTGMQSSLIR